MVEVRALMRRRQERERRQVRLVVTGDSVAQQRSLGWCIRTQHSVDGLQRDVDHVIDITHGRALVRLTGHASPELLAQLCAIDLDDRVTPNGRCLRSSVARVVTDIVRDDRDGQPSYLLHCERSSGAYLASQLTQVGNLYDLDIEGFTAATATR